MHVLNEERHKRLLVKLARFLNELVSSFQKVAATNLGSSSHCSCCPYLVLTCLNGEEARLKPPSVMSEIGYRPTLAAEATQ